MLSTSANARNSLYRQKPQQAADKDVSAWNRQLVALGTEAFSDIGQWSTESQSVVTNCFIRKSRHATKLAMYVNRTMLEAASATICSDHLDALTRLCGEKSRQLSPNARQSHGDRCEHHRRNRQ